MAARVTKCSHCGGQKFGEGYQSYQGRVQAMHGFFKFSPLIHIICLECGTIVRSYVKKPSKFKSKK